MNFDFFADTEAIIFDMDGTLVDSMGIWKEIDLEYLGRFGYELPNDLQKCIEGMCFHDTAVYIQKRFNIPQTVEEMKDTWNEMALYKYRNEVMLKPGAEIFLRFMKAKGIRLAIATSNSRLLTDAVLKARNIENYFDFVLTGCDSMKSKPDPEVYLTAAAKLGTDPSKCVVFEDIIPGIMAGKNAGMRVVAIDDAYSEYSKDEKIKLADYYLMSYEDIEISKGDKA